MTAQTILPANTLSSGGYDVANSVRFNRGDAAYMHKTPGTAGNVDVWTFSAWIKVAETGGHRNIFAQKVKIWIKTLSLRVNKISLNMI